jgi:hypothetical protein
VALEQDRPQQASKGRSFSLMNLDYDFPSRIFVCTAMLSSFLAFGWHLKGRDYNVPTRADRCLAGWCWWLYDPTS